MTAAEPNQQELAKETAVDSTTAALLAATQAVLKEEQARNATLRQQLEVQNTQIQRLEAEAVPLRESEARVKVLDAERVAFLMLLNTQCQQTREALDVQHKAVLAKIQSTLLACHPHTDNTKKTSTQPEVANNKL